MRAKIFVYGTLKKGQGADHLLRKCEMVSDDAKIHARMYDLGWYPGIKLSSKAEDIVTGELYSFPADEQEMLKTIVSLDAYEGAPNLYRRTMRYAYVAGVAFPTFVYEYNGTPDEKALISSGIWKPKEVHHVQESNAD